MANVPTVQVVDGDGYKVINVSDFDPDLYQIYKPPVAKIKKGKLGKQQEVVQGEILDDQGDVEAEE